MSGEQLSRVEIAAIARSLSLPTDAFINGAFRKSASGATFETFNPADRSLIASIASCDSADVDQAVSAAHATFDSGTWSRAHPSERKATLKRLAELIDRDRVELAVLETLESGKPIRDTLDIDVPETARCIEWFAEGIDKILGQSSPSGSEALGLIVREPIPVVACVLPWNFPLMMLSWKIGPALAVGSSIIVKPAEQTSMTALKIAALASEAGVPDGVLNVITGMGETAGRSIGLHPGIGAVSFTGSTEVGRLFLHYSADSNLKRTVLECGGKNPCVVLSDAGDLESVAKHAVNAAFWNMGQNCTANSRLIVSHAMKDELLHHVIAESQNWTMGDPFNPDNLLGSLISEEQFEKVNSYVGLGNSEGARLIYDGELGANADGYFVTPKIFDDVTPEMTIAKEEIFGPVMAVIAVDDDEEAIRVANDTDYGLQASVFTRDITRAHTIARRLEAGTVSVNCYSEGDNTTPFGGFKQSGFGGRDKSVYAYDQYVEKKTIWIDLG
jgi:gamma-glutamyl-gamma-aminobutyraldehyde dehydrogenase